MKAAAGNLRENKSNLSKLATTEMGKPISQALSEVEKCAWACEYYAVHAKKLLKPQPVKTDALKSYVTFRPLGVILAIMPWNFPFWQVFRASSPALMAGNAIILKHASNVSGCALAAEKIFSESGFPEGLFSTILVRSKRIDDLIAHPIIKAVTLTGSIEAGKAVAEKAGKHLKKTVLELGGSDPYLILADADLQKAAKICVDSRLQNSGQSCIAAKRFIVVESCLKEFETLVVKRMSEVSTGDPMNEEVVVGPLAKTNLRDQLHEQVLKSIQQGARLLIGGKMPATEGAFYPPTVLTGVKKGMPAYDEETFGPVASIISAANEEEAIKIANDSSYGLGSAVFTTDFAKGEKIASEKVESGLCFVNSSVKSDPRLPFGGIKESGYGRELSPFGIVEFVNIKTISICQ